MKAGQKAKAIESYERSLQLNSGNQNAVEMLKQLRGDGHTPGPVSGAPGQIATAGVSRDARLQEGETGATAVSG